MNYMQNVSPKWPEKFIWKMEWLDTNQVIFSGQLPKIVTWSNLWWCWGPIWNCSCWVCTAFTFRGGHNSADAQGAPDSLLQISALCTVGHLSKDKIFLRREIYFLIFIYLFLFFHWSIVELQCCVSSGVQQWFSYTYMYMHILFHILFHYGLL